MKEVKDALIKLSDDIEKWIYSINDKSEEFTEEIERIFRMLEVKTTKQQGDDLI